MLYWFLLITKSSFNASKRLIKCLNWIQCFFYYKLNASSRIPTILFKVSRWSSTIISRGFWRGELCSLHMSYSTRSKRVSPHPFLFLLLPNIYLWSDLAIFLWIWLCHQISLKTPRSEQLCLLSFYMSYPMNYQFINYITSFDFLSNLILHSFSEEQIHYTLFYARIHKYMT